MMSGDFTIENSRRKSIVFKMKIELNCLLVLNLTNKYTYIILISAWLV